MDELPFSPPEINVDIPNGSFWKQVGMMILATTISLLFTVLVTKFMDAHRRAKDRRLSAMMVMSNIEKFSRNLDEIAAYMAITDSTAARLLSTPIEELELMPEEELGNLISQTSDLLFLTYDKSAENIFSNNIETWKNMGNVEFIDRVGQCFSAMNMVEERWNNYVTTVEETMRDIKEHPEEYEGSTIPIKYIRSEKVRHTLKGIHYWRSWLSYMSATMRYHNRHNMNSIGITEKEVMEYTDTRVRKTENTDKAPDFMDFYSELDFDTAQTLEGR